MGVFDHGVECSIDYDQGWNELMVNIKVSYLDAFDERQITSVAYRDPQHMSFDLDRVFISGTATTGGRRGVGIVLFAGMDTVQILGNAQVKLCQWLDNVPPSIGEEVTYFETFHPTDGSITLFATRRECKHTQLVSINVAILDVDKNVDQPLLVQRVNPYTGKVF